MGRHLDDGVLQLTKADNGPYPAPPHSIEQRTRRNLQRRGEPFDDGDRGIARAPLDVAHIGPMNAGNVGKLFLTPAAVMPEAAQVYG